MAAKFGERKRHGINPPRTRRQAVFARLCVLPSADAAAPWQPCIPCAPPVAPLNTIDRACPPKATASTAALVAASGVGTGLLASTDLSARLEDLTGLALDRARDILQNPVDPDSDFYADELRAQTSTIKTALGTQVRVDENRLRKRELDVMPKLMAIIEEEERRLGLSQSQQIDITV